MTSSEGNFKAYSVQAKVVGNEPTEVLGRIFDAQWRQIEFYEAENGVPYGARYQRPFLQFAGLHSYEAAQALRWWFMAEADSYSIETRIVEHELHYTFKVSEGEPMEEAKP